MTPQTLWGATEGLLMPGTVSELFPQRYATSLGMTHNVHWEVVHTTTTTPPPPPSSSSTKGSPLTSRSPLQLSLLFSSHTPVLFLILSSSDPVVLSLSSCSCTPFASASFPLFLASLCSPFPFLSYFGSPLQHPPTPFPSSALLSPAFRLKTGSGKMASSRRAPLNTA